MDAVARATIGDATGYRANEMEVELVGGCSGQKPAQTRGGRLAGCAHLTSVAVALLAGMCVSACGSSTPRLNIALVEHAVAKSILTERDLHATVACPSKVPQKAGHVFTCIAHLDVGAYPVTVTETNGSGRVRYENRRPLVVLNIAKVDHAITASIFHQRGLGATVTCPAGVLQHVGIVFTCTATIDGKRYPFVVREVDGRGHVRYVGH